MLKESYLECIGNTPLVELTRLVNSDDEACGRLFAKIENLQPGLSKKSRIASRIITCAERNGNLKKGMCVIEATSGNTGIALSVVCAVKGYHFVAVMSSGNSIERQKMMSALGAELVIVPTENCHEYGKVVGSDFEKVKKTAERIARERNGFFVDQFNNPENPEANKSMGLEMVNDLAESNITELHGFADYVGTGGSFHGVSKILREHYPSIKCYVTEPANHAVFDTECPSEMQPHIIQGGGYGRRDLTLLKDVMMDGTLKVEDIEAKKMVHQLAKTEGIFASFSSAANVHAGLQLLRGHLKGGNVIVTICDTGLKYLSNDIDSV